MNVGLCTRLMNRSDEKKTILMIDVVTLHIFSGLIDVIN